VRGFSAAFDRQLVTTPLIAGNGRGGICGHQVGHFRRAVASLEGGAVKEGGSPPAPNWSLADRPATQTCPNPLSTLISTPVMYDASCEAKNATVGATSSG
jgi:hypothetical protein